MKDLTPYAHAEKTARHARIARLLAEYERTEGVRLMVVCTDHEVAEDINRHTEDAVAALDADQAYYAKPVAMKQTRRYRQ